MGIQGLLKGLNPILVPATAQATAQATTAPKPPSYSITAFRGATLAVDASSWLHRAGYSCAEELVEAVETGVPSARADSACSRYVLRRCEELLGHAGVGALRLVFDGRRCPLKAGTNREREGRRARHLAEARRLRAAGDRRGAAEQYRACVKPSDRTGHVVAEAVRRAYPGGPFALPRVTCVFSPYEADAQLAKLCCDGLADAVISEDSDILVYSAAVGVPFPVIYKLDRDTGRCDVISMDWLLSGFPPARLQKGGERGTGTAARQGTGKRDRLAAVRRYLPPPPEAVATAAAAPRGGGGVRGRGQEGRDGEKGGGRLIRKEGPFLSALRTMANREGLRPGSGRRLFVQACVLAGCDYAPSRLAGVGAVGAFRLVRETFSRDPEAKFARILRSVRDKILPAEEEGGGAAEGGNEIVGLQENGPGGEDGSEGGSTFSASRPTKPVPLGRARLAELERERMDDYEQLLARSERVFYYHGVLQLSDGRLTNLVKPSDPSPGAGCTDLSTLSASSSQGSSAESDSVTDGSRVVGAPPGGGYGGEVGTCGDAAAPDAHHGASKFLPSINRFDGDLSFAGSLDISVSGAPHQPRHSPLKVAPSLTRAPSVCSVANPYASKGQKGKAEVTASPLEREEKESCDGPSIGAHLVKRLTLRKQEASRLPTKPVAGAKRNDSNMFCKYTCATEEVRSSNVAIATDVNEAGLHLVKDTRGKDESSADFVLRSSDEDDGICTSRFFASSKGSRSRRVSLESPIGGKDKAADKMVSNRGNEAWTTDSFWSEEDGSDCIIVDSPGKVKPTGAVQRTNGSVPREQEWCRQNLPRATMNKENAQYSATPAYISAFQSGNKDRMSRVGRRVDRAKQQWPSNPLAVGFQRQREQAAKGDSLRRKGSSVASSNDSGPSTTARVKRNGTKRKAVFSSLDGYLKPLKSKQR